jgi:hypothetical protein
VPRDPNKEEAGFRRWLLDKLKQARWVHLAGDDIESVAKRLLIHPDAIRIAQRELNAQLRRRGRGALQIGTGRQRASRKAIELMFPKPIYEDWISYCRQRDLAPAMVLRSLMHALLSGESNPRWLGRGWRYRGQHLRMEGYTVKYRNKKWPYVSKAWVSQGSVRALSARAAALGVKQTALVRGMVIELLEGRLHHFDIIGAASEMWDDESRYVTAASLAKGTR